MKKAFVTIAVAFALIGAASAQPWYGYGQATPGMPGQGWNNVPGYGRGYGYSQQAPAVKAEKITVEGKLELVDARVAIVKEGKTYFLGIPQRLYGFVPGLVEGAAVKVEGYSVALPTKDSFHLQATSLTLGGRTIDLSQAFGRMAGAVGGMMGGRGMMGDRGCW